MSYLYLDGFDHFAYTDITKKWDIQTGATGSIGASAGRNAAALQGGTTQQTLTQNLPSNYSSGSAGVAYKQPSAIVAQANSRGGVMCVRDTGVTQISLKVNWDGSILVFRSDPSAAGTGLLGRSAPGIVRFGVWNYIEWSFTINNSTGSVTVYLNGVSVLSLTSQDTQAGTNATFNQFGLYYNSSNVFDDLYVRNDTTLQGDQGVYILYVSGAGTYTQWNPSAGSNYQNVDDTTSQDGDTTYNYESTVNDRDSYAMDNLPAKVSAVDAVQTVLCARKDDASTREIAPVVVSGATTSDRATVSLSSAYLYYTEILETDPDTAAAWTTGGVNAAEVGAKVIT